MPTTFEQAINHNRRLIRKPLEGSVFLKPWAANDEPITKIYTASTGLVIPSGYIDAGIIRKEDGVGWPREFETSDEEGWGYDDPVRKDVSKDATSMSFTMLESKRLSLELTANADYSGVKADADGNIVLDKPRRGRSRDWRVFSLAKDGFGADAYYFLRALPWAQVADVEEQTWKDGDALSYKVTMTGYFDTAWGTAVREVWGGPALTVPANVTAMGFQPNG